MSSQCDTVQMCNRTDCAGVWAGELACRVCEDGRLNSLDHALHLLRTMADGGDQQKRDAATVLAAYIERTERDQRRARMAGTRLLRAARRYKQAVKNMEGRDGQ